MNIIIKIKISANIIYKIDEFGNICSGKYIMEVLERNEHITKIKENVTMRIDNLLYDGHKIKSIEYDTLTNILLLEVEA